MLLNSQGEHWILKRQWIQEARHANFFGKHLPCEQSTHNSLCAVFGIFFFQKIKKGEGERSASGLQATR